MTRRLAVVASHPVQYQAPYFRALAQRLDLTVFFCQPHDADLERRAGYADGFSWDVPLLEGYRHVWLRNVARRPDVSRFSGCDTPEISERLAEGGFDVCVVHGWFLKSYLQAIVAGRRLGIPVLLRGDSQLATRRSLLRQAVKYLPYRVLLNCVAGHLVVGSANREYLRHYGVPDARLFDVPHAVDDRWFAAMADAARRAGARQRERAALGLPEDALVALFVGRLVPSKRVEDFVRALASPALATRIRGMIVGSGPEESRLRQLARSLQAPVVFAGFRNQRALPACYAAADLLVLPSDGRETWGLVANEALACGLPVVVSDAAGCARDLGVPAAGRTYPLGDVDGLAAAITSVAAAVSENPDAVAAAAVARSRLFSLDRAVDGTIAAVEAACLSQADRRRAHVASEYPR
ncbi:MAG TPA: glycosyltransferase family 4 protein [Vicinamibacterales bacterium]